MKAAGSTGALYAGNLTKWRHGRVLVGETRMSESDLSETAAVHENGPAW